MMMWCTPANSPWRNWQPDDMSCPAFYTLPACHETYVAAAKRVIERVNTYSGANSLLPLCCMTAHLHPGSA